jgi:hypothetical protein
MIFPERARTAARLAAIAILALLTACDSDRGIGEERFRELSLELEERFTPGLHTLMVELGMRHATLWFAGDARNWPLADYLVHEIEELVEDIEEMHPVYREVPVAGLLQEMTLPALDGLEDAVEQGDREGFVRAYDGLTQACNACHVASDRAAIVIQRPTAPPFTNMRFQP